MGRAKVRAMVYLALLVSLAATAAERAPVFDRDAESEARRIKAILKQPEKQMDLARIELTFDKMVEPSVDIEASLHQIETVVAQVRTMLTPYAQSGEKLFALTRFLYEPGPWNGYQTFQYDFDDPLGGNVHNRILAHYLRTRKGNCVTMPFLFVILGQRLGIDVTASTAPRHIFVKYTDPEGKVFNLEPTSGAKPARDEWLRAQHHITDKAISNGIYMQKLSKQETAAMMAQTVAEVLRKYGEYEKSIAVAEVTLAVYPKNIAAITLLGSDYASISNRDFRTKYERPRDIPQYLRANYRYVEQQFEEWFEKATALGWRKPSGVEEAEYLKVVRRATSSE